mgnify:CR=1 FL=1
MTRQQELWESIKSRYDRTNNAQMMVVETQLANLMIHDVRNIMDQIKSHNLLLQQERVSFGSKSTEAEFVYIVYLSSCLNHSQPFVPQFVSFPTHLFLR